MRPLMRTLAAAWVLTAPVTTDALAQDASTMASEFLDLCVSPSTEAQNACGAFVVGMIDVHAMLAAKNPGQRTVCPTRTLSPPRARQLFVEWADHNVQGLSMPFWMAVETAVRERYPCGAPMIRVSQR